MLSQDQFQILSELLHRHTLALEQIANSKNTSKLGFGEPPTPTYIYVKNDEGCLWYFFDIDKNQKTPIQSKALTGTITDIKLSTKDYKGAEKLKLNISISADKPYIIRSGLDTIFSRTLLLGLEKLTPQELSQPITIALEAGDSSCFCRLYQDDAQIRADWNPDCDLMPLVRVAQEKLGVSEDVIASTSIPSPTPAPILAPTPAPAPEPGKGWKTKEDALAWAQSKLPAWSPEKINELFDSTPPSPTGKKAKPFIERVEQLLADLVF